MMLDELGLLEQIDPETLADLDAFFRFSRIIFLYSQYMSILGFDNNPPTLTGFNNLNCSILYSDTILINNSTSPINVGDALNAITVDVVALETNIATLQAEMNSAESSIITLQSEMNDVQSDINTLQSEMNSVQADVIALGVSTGVTAATVAGLVITQASQALPHKVSAQEYYKVT